MLECICGGILPFEEDTDYFFNYYYVEVYVESIRKGLANETRQRNERLIMTDKNCRTNRKIKRKIRIIQNKKMRMRSKKKKWFRTGGKNGRKLT